MKSIGLKGFSLGALAIAAATLALQAQAAPVVSFSPASQEAPGPTATVDIVVNGLTEAVGAVALTLTFDSSILSGAGFVLDPTNAMLVSNSPFNDFSLGFGVGTLSLDFTYDVGSFANGAALFAAEGGGAELKLATLTFNTVGNGLSSLSFTGLSLAGYFDFINPNAANLNATGRDGSICVPGNCNNIPEPTTPLLVMAALGALALSRKSKQA